MNNLELYRVFYTVVKNGSLTKAAEELHITQPAASFTIKQLERQLGIKLFDRVYRGMELTEQGGKLIYPDVEKALRLLEGVEGKLRELREGETRTLRVGASASIFQYVLSSKIVEYRNLYPQVKIELISDVSPKIMEYLKEDACDIGFLNLPIDDEDDEIQIGSTVQVLNDIFVVGSAYKLLVGKTLTLNDIQPYPLILMNEGTVARASFENHCRAFGTKLTPAVEVDSWDFMKQLVTHGMGIGCIPREYVTKRLEQELLYELNVQPALPARSIGMALPKDKNMPLALQAFINLFERD